MTSDAQITPRDYALLAERVHETHDDVKEIKRALLGSLDHDQLGLIARMDITENAVVRVQHDVGKLRQEMEAPRAERRGAAREAISGGVGGIITAAAIGFWVWINGKT